VPEWTRAVPGEVKAASVSFLLRRRRRVPFATWPVHRRSNELPHEHGDQRGRDSARGRERWGPRDFSVCAADGGALIEGRVMRSATIILLFTVSATASGRTAPIAPLRSPAERCMRRSSRGHLQETVVNAHRRDRVRADRHGHPTFAEARMLEHVTDPAPVGRETRWPARTAFNLNRIGNVAAALSANAHGPFRSARVASWLCL
jgi:hypothetical protein